MLRIQKAALVAGMLVGLDRVDWLVHSVGSWTRAVPAHRWHGFVYVPLNTMFLIPLPVLLLFLWRSGGPLVLSRALRWLAFVIAVIEALLVADSTGHWVRFLSFDTEEIGRSKAWTTWLKVLGWLQTAQAPGRQFWLLVSFFSSVALLLFIIALLRHGNERADSGGRRTYWLREIAALTTIIGVIQLGWRLSRFAVALARGTWHWSSGFALVSVDDICLTLVAWIVYRSLQSSPAAPAE